MQMYTSQSSNGKNSTKYYGWSDQEDSDLLSIFASQPCVFPQGTDQQIINAFEFVDKDGNGSIDEHELRTSLSRCNQNFSPRSIRFIMCAFSKDLCKIGPHEFVNVLHSLKQWKDVFGRTDRNRDGILDINELRCALNNMGYPVSPKTVSLMLASYSREKCNPAINYDKFIECCLIVKFLSILVLWYSYLLHIWTKRACQRYWQQSPPTAFT